MQTAISIYLIILAIGLVAVIVCFIGFMVSGPDKEQQQDKVDKEKPASHPGSDNPSDE